MNRQQKQKQKRANILRKSTSTDRRRYFAAQKDRMVKKMLSLGYQMQYDLPRNEAQKAMRPSEVNFENVSAWCQSPKCQIRKPLDKMTVIELSLAITQFEFVHQSFIKSYASK